MIRQRPGAGRGLSQIAGDAAEGARDKLVSSGTTDDGVPQQDGAELRRAGRVDCDDGRKDPRLHAPLDVTAGHDRKTSVPCGELVRERVEAFPGPN